jgi:protein-S-isoprenylcysteine O-methyltransferase Ste14
VAARLQSEGGEIVHGNHSRAFGPPLALLCAHLGVVAVVVWLLLGDGLETLDRIGPFRFDTGSWDRRLLLASMSVVYLLRFALTSFVLLRRRMDWREVAAVIPWLAFIHGSLALLGGSSAARLGAVGVAGIVLYVLGSWLNTASEWGRMAWKKSPEHAGRLYTYGLFARAVHINYFGDLVLCTGFALVAGRWGALLVPILMAASFVFVHVPTLDAYLAERYGAEFRAYVERTKRLVPGVW